MWYQGRQTYAHRVAYELANGPIPEGMQVCHKCDIPSCVNPSHLFLGTQLDNIRDMMKKGRGKFLGASGERNATRKHPEIVRGENNGRAKRTWKQIEDIRQSYKEGETQVSIAARYGVKQGYISSIILELAWKSH